MDFKTILNNLGLEQLSQMQENAVALIRNNINAVVLAPTGSGKTLAFLLPLIETINTESDDLQALILSPTRELALQSHNVLKAMKTSCRALCCYGGRPAMDDLAKTDLYRDLAEDQIRSFRTIYEGAGYPVIETSVKTGEGIDRIREACRGRINLFSGESGVGKSSLIKALDPSLDPKIGTISAAHLQGKHTTSLYEMYPLSSGGYVIDSPGLRGFGLIDIEKEEIGKYFPEMLRLSQGCRFTPCTHTHEPGCAVKAAVEAGEIPAERYNSYLGMLEEDKKFR